MQELDLLLKEEELEADFGTNSCMGGKELKD